ncbi:ribosome maturation factor RimM [Candidatus Fukatsuia symbiotica]|uniref:Ribosome maturation factor RimM n=1 Tax=Candidatus Fukatsuia symbiotica TaxID=1878942 RepID=A0A2U8I6S2_9GAMM|nr:ribosome maturation factor RimM [Candidatus Fukatsuia symbiotica]AWK14797.1 ribosome maturation factor RimM [Candidatus Fukatsuia symbiotica]MEA9445132.1 ribosome maturation factor RimM [Candidatus Fukatsuia symbiotica]
MSKQLNSVVSTQPIVLGKVGSAYGIHGWLRVFSFTENANNIFDYQPWFVQQASQWRHLELESWKYHNRDLIIKAKGVDDREAASQLTNLEIIVDAPQLPPLSDGEYYWKDLIGCQVVTTSGYQLGKIVDMMETGSNDVMVVKANLKDAFGIKERLIPYLDEQVIKQVDIAAQRVEVDWEPHF